MITSGLLSFFVNAQMSKNTAFPIPSVPLNKVVTPYLVPFFKKTRVDLFHIGHLCEKKPVLPCCHEKLTQSYLYLSISDIRKFLFSFPSSFKLATRRKIFTFCALFQLCED